MAKWTKDEFFNQLISAYNTYVSSDENYSANLTGDTKGLELMRNHFETFQESEAESAGLFAQALLAAVAEGNNNVSSGISGTTTVTVVTDVAYDSNDDKVDKKTRTLTFEDGELSDIGTESSWQDAGSI